MATQNIFSMVDTWNNAGTTFTAIKMDVLDTASAAGSLLMDLQVGGITQLNLTKNGVLSVTNSVVSNYLVPQIHVGFAGGSNLAGATGNAIEQRNSTNAQAFRIYSSFTDTSNYERLTIGMTGSTFDIVTQNAGTGVARQLRFGNANTIRWVINDSGHFLAGADNTYDIGASGATRPRNGYFAGTILGNNVQASNAILIGNANGGISSPSDGVFRLFDNVSSSFNRLQFGGTTSSFPSLKRSSTTLQARLADDSAFAPIQGKLTTETAYTAGDPVTTGYLTLYDSNGTAYKVPAVAA